MIDLHKLDKHRVKTLEVLGRYGSFGDGQNGIFNIISKFDRRNLKVVASVGAGWEHVSVSAINRCPNWQEMEQIKRQFFDADETVMQLHVPPEAHINCHPYCLHLWKPTDQEIPRPPGWMVA